MLRHAGENPPSRGWHPGTSHANAGHGHRGQREQAGGESTTVRQAPFTGAAGSPSCVAWRGRPAAKFHRPAEGLPRSAPDDRDRLWPNCQPQPARRGGLYRNPSILGRAEAARDWVLPAKRLEGSRSSLDHTGRATLVRSRRRQRRRPEPAGSKTPRGPPTRQVDPRARLSGSKLLALTTRDRACSRP